jgi:hypothetical protein
MQSVLVVQVVRQIPVGLQLYAPHEIGVVVWQVPVPLQVRAGVNVVPEQVAAAHWVPAPYSRQAPLPLQAPSVLQLGAPRSAHWFSGSWPAVTLVHAPTVPASAHDWQVPPQVLPQQTPCAQVLRQVPAPQAYGSHMDVVAV